MGISLILTLLAKFGPYIALAAGLIAAYFHVKGKGIADERAKWEEAQRQTQESVDRAVSRDAEIKRKVTEKVETLKKEKELENAQPPPGPGDIFKF